MLLELKVSNFAIIDNIHIQFKNGLNILTGETGAGKSVLLKSLSLLMGGKGSVESIRSGFLQASIEGCFDISKRLDLKEKLAAIDIENEDNLLIVKRVIAEEKSRVYINGSLCTLNTLRDIVAPLIEVAGHAAPLIEMTGQFENRNLMSKTYHLDVVDQYSGSWELRQKHSQKFLEWQQIYKKITELKASAQMAAQRLDFLTYQRDEIAALHLSPNEDLEIESELKKAKNSARLTGFVELAEETLLTDGDSVVSRISIVLKKAFEVSQQDPELAKKAEALRTAQTLIEDVMFEIRQYASRIDNDPQRMETLEQRLSDLRKLQKKYGPSVEVILNKLLEIESEILTLKNVESHVEDLETKAQTLHVELLKMALDLHKRRKNGAKLLADSVNEELLDLNMKGVTFHVELTELSDLNVTGKSEIEFMSQTSSKDPKRPLAKFASGGELSRILLSLKRVVGSSHMPRTYLFDEVDTGVSGPTAEKVGKKLHSISEEQQVICVTHLPQVAAFADTHFYIQKSQTESVSKKTGVAMTVLELSSAERVKEIARLISGEKISKTSLAHAEELLSQAH